MKQLIMAVLRRRSPNQACELSFYMVIIITLKGAADSEHWKWLKGGGGGVKEREET